MSKTKRQPDTLSKILRVCCTLIGLLFLGVWVTWLVAPAAAAAQLKMPLLAGAAGNTQIGDLAAFFFATALFTLLGCWQRSATWLMAGAVMVGGAALFRVLAWSLHDTVLVGSAVALEVVCLILLAGYAAHLRLAED